MEITLPAEQEGRVLIISDRQASIHDWLNYDSCYYALVSIQRQK